MTITEAKKQWKVSYDTMCQWLEQGIIPDVEIIDGAVSINDPKPIIPKKGAAITVENVRKYILTACNEMGYTDYKILHIKKEHFCEILSQLEESKYIKCRKNVKDVDYSSNKDFVITDKGNDSLKKDKFKLEKLNITINFKYLGVATEIERGN